MCSYTELLLCAFFFLGMQSSFNMVLKHQYHLISHLFLRGSDVEIGWKTIYSYWNEAT